MKSLMIILMTVCFCLPALAKKKSKVTFKVPDIKRQTYKGRYMKSVRKAVKKHEKNTKKDGKVRKVANEQEFTAKDVEKDVQELGKTWKNINTPEELHARMSEVIAEANKKDSNKSNAYKLLAGTFEIAEVFRGLIWRARPMLEDNGNKMTHITAIQMIRGISNGIGDWLPNPQYEVYKRYTHIPGPEFTEADRFSNMSEFQAYLVNDVIPTMTRVSLKLEALLQAEPMKNYVYDNRWAWGPNDFPTGTDVKRYSAIGFGEKNIMLSSLYEAKRDFLVFSAYNHDAMVQLAGELSTGVGIDAFGLARVFNRDELGMSDREKIGIVKGVTNSNPEYMKLRSSVGPKMMTEAYDAMVSSVTYLRGAYSHFNSSAYGGADNRPEEIRKYSDRAIENLARISTTRGSLRVREPLTGKTATVNVYAFYHQPPRELERFLATSFAYSRPEEKDLKELKVNGNPKLKYRNYDFGQSNGWSNGAWGKYVPSARGKQKGYMLEAKRIITSSGGTSFAFGLPTVFVH